MAIDLGDLVTVLESGANGTIIRIDGDGSDSGTFYDVRLTGTGGRFPAGDVARCVRAEIDAGYPDGHCGHEGCCGPLPWRWDRPVGEAEADSAR